MNKKNRLLTQAVVRYKQGHIRGDDLTLDCSPRETLTGGLPPFVVLKLGNKCKRAKLIALQHTEAGVKAGLISQS